MNNKISVTKKLLLFVAVFFILAAAHSWLFLNSINQMEKYVDIINILSSMKTDIAAVEFKLDIAIVGSDFKSGYGAEGLNEEVLRVDKEMEQLKGLPDAAIFSSNPILSGDYKALLNDWEFARDKINGLRKATSKEEVFLIHNDVDLKTFLITERLERLRKFVYDEKAKLFSDLGSRIISSLLFAIVIALIAIYIFYRKVIHPIKAMARAAARVAEGDSSVRFKAASKDEIGVLSNMLNSMADTVNHAHATLEKNVSARTVELETKIRELTAINKVAGSPGRSLSHEEIAGLALDEIMHLTNADAGWVYIMEPSPVGSDTRLHLRAQRGLSHAFIREAKELKLQEIGLPMKGKEHILINTSEIESRFKPLLEAMGIQRLLVTPVVSMNSILGIVQLASKNRDGFSNKKSCLFAESIASEIAHALETIHLFQKEYKSRQFIERIIYQSPIALWVSDKSGTCVMLNPACRRLFGIDHDEQVVGKYNLFKDNILGDQGHLPLIRKVFEGESVEMEVEYDVSKVAHIQVKGGARKLKTKLFPIIDNDGSMTNIVVMHEDVTKEEELKKQLFRSEKLSAISQLVSGVVHELNNPLTGITGHSKLLINSPSIDISLKNAIEKIVREAERVSKIVQNLLIFAREYKPQKSYVNINDVLSSVLELRTYDFTANNIEVIKDFADEIPCTMADPFQLQQAFLNIINNAIDALKGEYGKGKIIVRTRHCKLGGEVPCDSLQQWGVEGIVAEFTDNGPGISEENQQKLFEPFFTTKANGTGLGLAISYGIVKEHGGTIYVKSRMGLGTTFKVEIPIIKGSLAR